MTNGITNEHMNKAKATIRHVLPSKTQINLYTHTEWQGFSFIPLDSLKAVEGTCDQ